MSKGLFALMLAGALVVSPITASLGEEGTVGLGTAGQHRPQADSWGTIALPPVPHLESTPWLTTDSLLKGPKVDVLLGPKVETLGPFLLAPSIPPRQFSSLPAAPEPQPAND